MATNYPASLDSTAVLGFQTVANLRRGATTASLGSGVNGTLQVDFDPVTEGYPASGYLCLAPADNSQKPLVVSYSSRSASGGSPGSFAVSTRGLDGTTDRNIASGEYVAAGVIAAHHNDHSDAIIAAETKLGTGASTPTTTGHVLQVTGAGATAYNTIGNALGFTPKRIYNAVDYGVVADDSTDCTTPMTNFLAAVVANNGIGLLPPGRIKITSGLTVGNGSAAGPSSVNDFAIIGHGPGSGASETGPYYGTELRWHGAAGGTMLTVNGPIVGILLKDIALDGKASTNAADVGLLLKHPIRSRFEGLSLRNFAVVGLDLTAYPAPTNVAIGAMDNTFVNVATIDAAAASATGWRIGAATKSTSPYFDVAQCTFLNCRAYLQTATSVGMELRYCDNLSFVHCHLKGTTAGLKVSPPSDGASFPGSVVFFNSAVEGGVVAGATTWTGEHPIFFWPYPTGDSEPVPTANFAAGMDSQLQTFGAWGKLGLGESPGSYRLSIVSAADDHVKLQRAGSGQVFKAYVDSGNTWTFDKPIGAVGSNAHALFRFSIVGALDADNGFWNGLQLMGPSVTEGASTRYPITTLYHRAATGTDPTDYELVAALGNMGTLRGGLSFVAPAVDASTVRFGFGSDSISEEGIKVTRTSSTQRTVSLATAQVGGGAVLKKLLSGTATYDPPSTATGAAWTTTVTVTGAAVGDNVMVAHTSVTSGDWNLYGYVSATDTVRVYGRNNTGSTTDLASGTLRATVFQF